MRYIILNELVSTSTLSESVVTRKKKARRWPRVFLRDRRSKLAALLEHMTYARRTSARMRAYHSEFIFVTIVTIEKPDYAR